MHLNWSHYFESNHASAFLIWVEIGEATLPIKTLRLQVGFLNAH